MKQLLRIIAGNKFLKGLLVYNALIYILFVGIYHTIDFEKHFDLPPGTRADTGFIMYYTWLSHCNVMAGECVPKTSTGRQILAYHILMSWGVILVMLAPWGSDMATGT